MLRVKVHQKTEDHCLQLLDILSSSKEFEAFKIKGLKKGKEVRQKSIRIDQIYESYCLHEN